MVAVNKAWRFVVVLALVGGAVAQAPVVPTDHYGPPVCSTKTGGHSRHGGIEEGKAQYSQGAADPHSIVPAEPMENFSFSRMRIADYADCVGPDGCYWTDLDAQFKRAEAALHTAVVTKKPGDKLALVLDIDETSLSGYCEMKHEDFGWIEVMSDAWTLTPEAAVTIPGALRLFNKAKAEGVAVFFITGRPNTPAAGAVNPRPSQKAVTERNLKLAGFEGWTGIALREGEENNMPTSEFKSLERKKIADKGYRIVMSVGDQWSDLRGNPQAEINVKLPNPFYFLP